VHYLPPPASWSVECRQQTIQALQFRLFNMRIPFSPPLYGLHSYLYRKIGRLCQAFADLSNVNVIETYPLGFKKGCDRVIIGVYTHLPLMQASRPGGSTWSPSARTPTTCAAWLWCPPPAVARCSSAAAMMRSCLLTGSLPSPRHSPCQGRDSNSPNFKANCIKRWRL